MGSWRNQRVRRNRFWRRAGSASTTLVIVGLLTEDQGSVGAWSECLGKLHSNDTFVGPLFAPMSPNGAPAKVADSALPQLKILKARNVERVVVFIDLEDANACAAPRRAALEDAFAPLAADLGFHRIDVVLKKTQLENWLCSDPERHRNSRYELKPGRLRVIRAGSADNVPGELALKEVCNRPPYSKTTDPARILSRNNPYRMAMHSRSFRKMLQLLGVPAYANQSARPVPVATIPQYNGDE